MKKLLLLFSAKTCPYSSLPPLPNGRPVSKLEGAGTVVGGFVIYQCNTNYRIAPRDDRSGGNGFMTTYSTQKVTCQSNLTFTPLQKNCVCE